MLYDYCMRHDHMQVLYILQSLRFHVPDSRGEYGKLTIAHRPAPSIILSLDIRQLNYR